MCYADTIQKMARTITRSFSVTPEVYEWVNSNVGNFSRFTSDVLEYVYRGIRDDPDLITTAARIRILRIQREVLHKEIVELQRQLETIEEVIDEVDDPESGNESLWRIRLSDMEILNFRSKEFEEADR